MEAPKFIELKAHEEVLEVVYASMIPRLPRVTLLVVWILLPFFFLFPLWREGGIGLAIFAIWLFSGVLLLVRAYLTWSRTVFVVTDMRVIDYDQKGFFHRVVTQTRFDQIDEVSYHIKGIFPTLFGYGTLQLQLQGSSADIQVEQVKRPNRIADLINDLRRESEISDSALHANP
ncbi:PH domain-containing protein [Candidatus Uhrbacteria bacterium]|nr:PH domain-containing protein [Candidatus Uhrbacteria bacterium]